MHPSRAFATAGVLALHFLAVAACSRDSERAAAAVEETRPKEASASSSVAANPTERAGQHLPSASPPRGRWRAGRLGAAGSTGLTPVQQKQLERLQAIGYVAGSVEAGDRAGVVVHDEEKTFPGLNFYTSGNAPEAVLMDMNGTEVHRWSFAFRDAFPEAPDDLDKPDMHFWRKAHLFPNGDVLAIHEGLGLVKVDRHSRLLWARRYPVHHDLEVLSGGEILVLTRIPHLVPEVSSESLTLEDFVTRLASDGEEIRRLSLLEAFENAAPEYDWRTLSRRFWNLEDARIPVLDREDIFHTNALRVLDGSLEDLVPAFAAGRYLVSMRHLDTIAVVDPDTPKVVWTMTGPFALQHDPRITPEGRILVFDNHWKPGTWSRVMAVDPLTLQTAWEYRGSPETPLFSSTCGAAHPLANGNVLVVESDNGRVFEVTRSNQIVWEFLNPARAGPDDQFVATVFDLERIDPSYVASWLDGSPTLPARSSSGR